MRTRIVIVLGVVLALALPVVAQAGLPKATNTLIVPAKSLGGVALGSSTSAVTKAWGKNKKCESSGFSCVYEGKNSGELASAVLETANEGATYKVAAVFITVSETLKGTTLTPDFNTPLTKFKTAKGIGIGSTMKELQRAYPKAKKDTLGGGFFVFALAGPGTSFTEFQISHGGIKTIAIRAHPGG
jgi:hypothetical protein